MTRILIVFLFFCVLANPAFAEQILLKNGDKISGKIIQETDQSITLETEAMGRIDLNKDYVVSPEPPSEAVAAPETEVKRSLSLGYSQSGGNTESSEFSGQISFNAKSDHDEWTGKVKSFYSSSDKKMDARKFSGLLRYAYSFGQDLKWYHFYKFEADQDRFSNIDYRFVPSSGVGYWFSDNEDFKALTEAALGYEYTFYREPKDQDGNVLLITRAYLDKQITETLRIAEDVTFYPSLEDLENYRFVSETSLKNQLKENIFWKMSFIDEYNSSPSGDVKKNDYRVITSIGVEF